MKNLTWQNPEQLFVAQELINKVKSKCCGIKEVQKNPDIGKDLAEVWEFFRYVETTRLDCSLSTGILLGSVCRYVDYLLKIGALQVTKIAPDKRTKHDAQYLSADVTKWQKPKFVQLSLFGEGSL